MFFCQKAAGPLRSGRPDDLNSQQGGSGFEFPAVDRGANLSNAILWMADLSSANLYGASLYGANLSGAAWTDGIKCQEGSIGTCNK